MAINFGHVFAAFFQKVVAVKNAVVAGEKKVVAALPAVEAGITAVEATEPVVELVTTEVPKYGPLALPIEKLVYALLGEVAHILVLGGDAAAAKFADAGMDIAVIKGVQDVVKVEAPQIAALAAAK